MKSKTPIVCSIGSVDPTGAAGLTRDLAAYNKLGAASVVTVAAVTAQNDRRVEAVAAVAPNVVSRQLEVIWEQVRPDAVCIGLLPDAAGIRAIRNFLTRLSPRPAIVIDPVLEASNGYEFLGAREIRELKRLLPLATIATPNLNEAAKLTSHRVATLPDAEAAARQLSQHGCAVLVTGGHLPGPRCIDVLAWRGRAQLFSGSRLETKMRGTGGILAAAIAVNLARGFRLDRAVARARTFVRSVLRDRT